MITAAVISEFNPFHLGHAYLIGQARQAGADAVFALMSGNYVQRGEPALLDRRARAEAALRGGADLVLGYPARYATASAEHYADCAVRTLAALRGVDLLVFGSECGQIEPLLACAEVLTREPPAYRAALHDGLRAGLSYPKARAAALPEYAGLLGEPNNILAVEYLKALIKLDFPMKPVTVRRVGAGHHPPGGLAAGAEACAGISLAVGAEACDGTSLRAGAAPCGPYASAGTIRKWILTSAGDSDADSPPPTDSGFPLSSVMPESSLGILTRCLERNKPLTLEDFYPLILEKLWRGDGTGTLTAYEDVDTALAGTLLRERTQVKSCAELVARCASKSLTASHVRRALLHIALGIEKQKPDPAISGGTPPLIAEVLGVSAGQTALLSRLRREAQLPLLVNPLADREKLTLRERKLFDEELRVNQLYEALLAAKSGRPPAHLFSFGLLKT